MVLLRNTLNLNFLMQPDIQKSKDSFTMSEQSKIIPDPATSQAAKKQTQVGSVFVSNYPPYSFWQDGNVEAAMTALNTPAPADRSLGLYMHIPFCRKRCKFCYFKVYTGKNSNEIQEYLDALSAEIELYAKMPGVINRALRYIYFGGGTPSFISVKHLNALVNRAKAAMSWDQVEEVAFECEPGTLTQSKLEAIKGIGVTRLSVGVEHFNDEILSSNGRAHLSKEIYRVQPWIKALNFDQVNIDLISGMIGESWDSWKDTVDKAIDFDADSVTIYQLELPFNAIYSQDLRTGNPQQIQVADWETKREWHNYAIEKLSEAGYMISSAYTMVKKESANRKFVYRDALWKGSDMLPTGVASFGHIDGIHFQNASRWDEYVRRISEEELPVQRAFITDEEERLTREMILQLKLGTLKIDYFQNKFNVNILDKFSEAYRELKAEGMLDYSDSEIRLTREGLLQVDNLLPKFYAEKYQNARYT